MKYLCFDGVEYHTFVPWLSHKYEAALRPHKRVTSAGWVCCTPAGVECYGESTSLGIKSDPRDTLRMNALMRKAA